MKEEKEKDIIMKTRNNIKVMKNIKRLGRNRLFVKKNSDIIVEDGNVWKVVRVNKKFTRHFVTTKNNGKQIGKVVKFVSGAEKTNKISPKQQNINIISKENNKKREFSEKEMERIKRIERSFRKIAPKVLKDFI